MVSPERSLADAVAGNIAGQARADRMLEVIRAGTSHPDQLHADAMRVWAEYGSPGLLGYHRRLQKTLERAG